jgi:hypothetical protein
LLVIVAFISAFLELQYGVAVLFIIALSFFTLSLVDLVREARISLQTYEESGSGPVRPFCHADFRSGYLTSNAR